MKKFYTLLIEHRSISALLLVACIGLLYVNSLDNAFQYDDRHSIVENPHIRDLGHIVDFFVSAEYFSRDADKAMYRPLLLASLALNYAWSGYDTYSYHLVNIIIHALCALCVWGILLQLGRPPCMALLGALLFAVHPLCSEPVNYISSRSELMAAWGALTALWLYMLNSEKNSLLLSGLSVLFFAIGLFSKSIGIVFPLWLIAWDRQRNAPWRWLHYAPYLAIAALYLLLVRSFLTRAVIGEPVRSWDVQLATQVKALVYYVYLAVAPFFLSVDHAFAESPLGDYLPWLCTAFLGSAGWFFYRARGEYLGYILGGSALLPTLIVPLNVLVNEHRLYLPVAGLAIVLSGLRVLERVRFLGVGAPLFIGLCFILTMQRNTVWLDEYTLWGDVAEKNPHAVRPYMYLGNAARSAGNAQQALIHYNRALQLDSTHVVARAGLATAYQDLGRFDEAITGFKKAIEADPLMVDLNYSLARALQEAKHFPEARQYYFKVPAQSVHYGIALNNLGTLYELEGRADSALHYYTMARRQGATDGAMNAHRLLQKLVQTAEEALQRGDAPLAETLSRQAVAVDENLLYSRFFLAISLFQQRLYEESIKENREVVRRFPAFDDGYLQLANALETRGHLVEARQIYQTLLGRTRDGKMRQIAIERLQRLEERIH